MSDSRTKKVLIVLAFAFTGWVLCAVTMGVGMALMSLQSAMVVHAVLAPVFFTVLSIIYYRKFNYTTPLKTAVIFLFFVAMVDFFIVALLINQSLEMFASVLGAWIPFGLIFVSVCFTGIFIYRKR